MIQEKDCFSREELDAIAIKLSDNDPNERKTWTPLSLVLKPHHNVFTGNYNVDVLIAALESRKRSLVWHDRRNKVSSIWNDGDLPPKREGFLGGFILNVPVRKMGGLWKSRHWIALQRIDGVWYNLDSDLSIPRAFEEKEQLMEFLDNAIAHGGELFVIWDRQLPP